ncbi:MAG TPA: hypothetical protein DCL60_06425 [Armatimonadetes bacterium]|nr:hypothetical protein [Armatimonadota bacterium]
MKETEIICTGCGAVYSSLPGITCPRCCTPLCQSGCEGCTAACGLRLTGGTSLQDGIKEK